MTKKMKRVPVAKGSALAAMVAELEADKEPRVLEANGKAVAALISLEDLDKILERKRSRADVERALSAAGAWKDLPGNDEIAEYVRKARHASPARPPVDF